MKVVFSRKGFDSAAGKSPSPIIDGRPISMPIPATRNATTTYQDVGLGEVVEQVTRGRIGGDHLCHHDPMFVGSECLFGQCGAAQSHLAHEGVGIGDVLLFFGLFADEATREGHHRFFGWMRIEEIHLVWTADDAFRTELIDLGHPHVFGERPANNTVYRGEGGTAKHAMESLRLTRGGGPLSRWIVPPWLCTRRLSYHSNPDRWIGETELLVVARGQEFVCDIGDDLVAHAWVDDVIRMIRS